MKTVNTLMTITGFILCTAAVFAACDNKSTPVVQDQKDAEVVAPPAKEAVPEAPVVDAGATDQ